MYLSCGLLHAQVNQVMLGKEHYVLTLMNVLMVLIIVIIVLQCVLANPVSSFTCSGKSGHARNRTLCTDIDECSDGAHNCHFGRATYSNNVGSFTSACKSGYTGMGTLCTDTDE